MSSLIFFVDEEQTKIIEKAIELASRQSKGQTRASRRAGAMMKISSHFVGRSDALTKIAGCFVDDLEQVNNG